MKGDKRVKDKETNGSAMGLVGNTNDGILAGETTPAPDTRRKCGPAGNALMDTDGCRIKNMSPWERRDWPCAL